jgi:hypothetical protein
MTTASEPECSNIEKKANKKAKRTEVNSWFCDMRQQESVED